jgi:hypothetical protein
MLAGIDRYGDSRVWLSAFRLEDTVGQPFSLPCWKPWTIRSLAFKRSDDRRGWHRHHGDRGFPYDHRLNADRGWTEPMPQ